MASQLRFVIDQFIAEGKEIQVKLRGDANPGPMGPGKISLIKSTHPDVSSVLYQLETPAMLGLQGQKPRQVVLPIIFSLDDVLWISPGPTMDGDPMVVTPHGRTPGGLHVPGGQ